MNITLPNTTRLNSQKSTKLSPNNRLLISSKQPTQINNVKTFSTQDNSAKNNINDSQISENSLKSNFQVKSFTEATANSAIPKMDQAIVMNSVDRIIQIQYIIALNKIMDATNIISALRISNNRFCIFL